MKILVLNYEFPPFGGGASSACFYTSRELVRHGHHVDVLTSGVEGQSDFETVDGISVYRVASMRRSAHEAGYRAAICYLFFARRKLRELLHENVYDYGYFYFAIPTGLLAFRWRAMTSAPYIVSLRGSDVPNYDPNARGINILHRLLKPVTRIIMHHANSVVANSESLRQLALGSFPRQRIITITNGVCTQNFKSIQDIKRDTDTITALAVARLIPRKGIHGLLSAFAACKFPNLRLVIVGSGPEHKALSAHAKQLHIDERVNFVGAMYGKDLVAYYRAADFLIHPTLTESFSMTLLEAMSCSLPIVTTDIGGVPELIKHEINGLLVAPGDILALANAIDRMAKSDTLRSRCSLLNRAEILHQFTWAHIVRQYEKQCFSAARLQRKDIRNGA